MITIIQVFNDIGFNEGAGKDGAGSRAGDE